MNRLPSSFRRYLPTAAAAAVVAALSLLPARLFHGVETALPPVHGFDKIVHAVMYAALTVVYLRARPSAERGELRTALEAAVIASLYGALMELCQNAFTVSRQMDPFDEIANAAGAFASALVLRAWARHRMRRGAAPVSNDR